MTIWRGGAPSGEQHLGCVAARPFRRKALARRKEKKDAGNGKEKNGKIGALLGQC